MLESDATKYSVRMRMITRPVTPLAIPRPTVNRLPPMVAMLSLSQVPALVMIWLRSTHAGRFFCVSEIQVDVLTVVMKSGRFVMRLLTWSAITGTTAKTRPAKTARMPTRTVTIAAQRGNLCFSSQETAGSSPRAMKSAAPT